VVSTVASQQKGSWFEFACSPRVCGGSPASPLPSKNMHVRLIGESELSLGVSVRPHGCVSRLCLCGAVMDQGVPCLSPNDSWERLL